MTIFNSNRRRRSGNPRGGFTLFEVLVAVVILSFGLVRVLAGFNTYMTAFSASRESLRASLLMERKMMEIRMTALDGKIGLEGLTGHFFEDNGWSGSVDLQAVGDLPQEGRREYALRLYKVDLEVTSSWSDRQYSLTTYVHTRERL